ncbi:MAG TPA: acyl-CoA desaturase [Planktothrix sp.]|jgi:stearoyl-CoA desaturase (delta-9 desaturase)
MNEFIAVFAISYLLHTLGVTIGYHRLISHRSFASPKFVEYFWVLMGYLAFEGSPIWWATIHRAHHRYVDTPLDPHSPRYGLHNAHFGWLMHRKYPSHIDPQSQSKDLVDDPLYRFLEQGGNWWRAHVLVFAISIGVRLVIWACFGWVAALASLAAAMAVLQIPLMLNVFCHIPKLGYKNFRCVDDSVNVWWVALLAMGEGWHNNHHVFPGSARSGIRAHELDVSWLVICAMRKLGWATRINEVSEHKVTARLIEDRKPQLVKTPQILQPAPQYVTIPIATTPHRIARRVASSKR